MTQKKLLSLIIISLFILSASKSIATTDKFSLLFLRPAQSPGDLMITPGSNNLYKNQWQLFAEMEYQHRPLELTRSNVVAGGISDKLFIQHLGASYAPTSWWQIDLDVPVVWYNKFTEPTLPLTSPSSIKTGLGDIFLRQRITLLRRSEHAVGFSINPFVTAPTGNENYFQADNKLTGGGSITVDTELGKKVSLALNTGMEVRQSISFFDYTTSHRPFVSGGGSVQITDKWQVSGEGFAMTNIKKPFQQKINTPVEFLFGTKYQMGKSVQVNAGGALSIVRAAGVPLFRTMAGLSYTYPPWAPTPRKKVIKVIEEIKEEPVEEIPAIRNYVIFFETESAQLSEAAQGTLDTLLSAFKNKNGETSSIMIAGHTDSLGPEAYNMKLSYQRAENVADYLTQKGVDPLSIAIDGHGETQPLENNTTKEGRARNRRVEIKIP